MKDRLGNVLRGAGHLALAGLATFAALAAIGALAVAATSPTRASTLQLNETYVEGVTAGRDLDTTDVKAVFAFVFKQLPDRVKVYPTEHYYYFKFLHGGIVYAGNFRLENELRDQGKIHFAYTAEYTEWLPPGETLHRQLEAKDGVTVERIDGFSYRVSHDGKTVRFDLNRMEGVKPPAEVIDPEEVYIGPIQDESAVRFFLVYNPRLKQFLYLLDETGPPSDMLVTSQLTDRMLIGQRTGFVFYRDHRRERRILIGVYANNARVNNYFDGPFDQLPDNFLDGDILRDAILEVEPELKGQIDRYGSSFDGETRYMIAPYLYYEQEEELAIFHRCATNRKVPAERYYACFVLDDVEGQPPRAVGERDLQRPQKTRRPAGKKRSK